jgi:hypothetical protein
MRIINAYKIKALFSGFFRTNSLSEKANELEEAKRNRLLKKMRSNAIAITTNQIGIHSGCMKMNNLRSQIDQIRPLTNISLEVFENFYTAFCNYPIEEERQNYNAELLKNLDQGLNPINDKYKPLILEKCKEIIEKL